MRIAKLSLLSLAMMLAACNHAPTQMYQWGSYQDQIYGMYSDTGKVPVESQVETLEADYQRIRASNGAVPPGFHAHLGYLYFQLGKDDQAWQSFATEKALFPESTIYMDRLMARLKQKRST